MTAGSKLLPTLGVALMLGMVGGRVRSEELSRNDKLNVLYSNQFAFDRQGIPLIPVRVAAGSLQVTLESSKPLRLLPEGEDGTEIVSGKRWKITLTQGRPAVLEHFAVLAHEPVIHLPQIRQELAAWQKRGISCQMIEVGTVFGVKGTVFDNRALVVAGGPFPSQKAAAQAAEGYAKKYHLDSVATLPRLKQRPSGLLEASDLETSVRVRARDVLWFAPTEAKTIAVQSGSDKPRSYWGQIYVTVDTDGTLSVVNVLPAEQLLAGLVPAEIFPQAPEAALKAQAVAARGELLAKIGIKHLTDPYLLCATQHCQVYAGAGHEHPRTTRAVNATKGMVLMRKSDGRLVDTVYSASCGGHTEHNEHAWPTKPDATLRGHLDGEARAPGLARFRRGIKDEDLEAWLAPQPDTWCGRTRLNQNKFRWTITLSSEKVNSLTQKLNVGVVKGLRVLGRGVSGRANLLLVEGTRASSQVRGELAIRQVLGGLPSSLFVMQTTPGATGLPKEFIFHGGGWGHGVGMCQTGAIGMAEAGKRFEEILKHYYLESDLKPLY